MVPAVIAVGIGGISALCSIEYFLEQIFAVSFGGAESFSGGVMEQVTSIKNAMAFQGWSFVMAMVFQLGVFAVVIVINIFVQLKNRRGNF